MYYKYKDQNQTLKFNQQPIHILNNDFSLSLSLPFSFSILLCVSFSFSRYLRWLCLLCCVDSCHWRCHRCHWGCCFTFWLYIGNQRFSDGDCVRCAGHKRSRFVFCVLFIACCVIITRNRKNRNHLTEIEIRWTKWSVKFNGNNTVLPINNSLKTKNANEIDRDKANVNAIAVRTFPLFLRACINSFYGLLAMLAFRPRYRSKFKWIFTICIDTRFFGQNKLLLLALCLLMVLNAFSMEAVR